MGLPKDLVKPAYNYTYPSERDYFDETGSTLAAGVLQTLRNQAKITASLTQKWPSQLQARNSETGNGAGEAG